MRNRLPHALECVTTLSRRVILRSTARMMISRQLIHTIFAQDRAIVERQRPEELPLDLSEELHLSGPDAGTLQYRRMLGEIGVH
jgi:phenylpropionate dioxygenase-like ring-hydroxylating dioxygenase large terminal subunit